MVKGQGYVLKHLILLLSRGGYHQTFYIAKYCNISVNIVIYITSF